MRDQQEIILARSIIFYTLGLQLVSILLGISLLFVTAIYYGVIHP